MSSADFCVYVSFLGLFPKMERCQDILYEDFLCLHKECPADMSFAEDVSAKSSVIIFAKTSSTPSSRRLDIFHPFVKILHHQTVW